MKTFRTLTPVTIGDGKLALTEDQAALRMAFLTDLGEGIYQVNQPIQFKAGETFGHDHPVPKALALCLEEADIPIDDQDPTQLRILAGKLGLKPAGNLGKTKLLKAIKDRQEELGVMMARAAELEALTEPTEAENNELNTLKAALAEVSA